MNSKSLDKKSCTIVVVGTPQKQKKKKKKKKKLPIRALNPKSLASGIKKPKFLKDNFAFQPKGKCMQAKGDKPGISA